VAVFSREASQQKVELNTKAIRCDLNSRGDAFKEQRHRDPYCTTLTAYNGARTFEMKPN